MSYPGEYIQPISRKTVLQCPVISGYVTARLRAQDAPVPTYAGQDTTVTVIYENVGNGTIAFAIQSTDDRSISGARTTLVNVGAVAGGHGTIAFVTKQAYLEIRGTLGSGNIRTDIQSIRQWQELAFGKDDPFYPPQLFQAKLYNTPAP